MDKNSKGHGKVEEGEEMINWLNSLRLSKPIKNLDKDFADAVLAAEFVAHFLPRYVPLNAFVHVHSVALKKYNWESLDKVVLRHLGIRLGTEQCDSFAQGIEGAFQSFLPLLRSKIDQALEQRRFRPSSRSRPSSRGGSQLNLDQIGLNSSSTSSQSAPREMAERNAMAKAKGTSQIPVLDEMDKDQLIERLYAKVRLQEGQLARKEEQIEALTRRVDKLVEMICERKMPQQNGGKMSSDGGMDGANMHRRMMLNGGDFD